MKSRSDLYDVITQKIIDSLEKGIVPWQKPWKGDGVPINFKTGYKYKGMNLLLLGLSNFSVPYFLTFKQVREMGGRVKKGAVGTLIIFWSFVEKIKTVDGIDENESYPVLQYYHVFNVTQTEGIDYESRLLQISDFSPIATCDEIILRYQDCPNIEHKEQSAFYNKVEDFINMPLKKSFNGEEDYYKTLFHEMIHSTGHKNRLNRDMPAILNSLSGYSKEELVAEMGANFLCGHGRLELDSIDQSASYIDHWLKALKENKRFIFSVTGQAQKAVEYILGHKQTKPTDEKESV